MNHRTVLLVAHPEAVDDDSGADRVRVVLDRLLVWPGSRAAPVDLDDVTETALTLSREFRAPVIYDPHQAAQLSQQLRAAGVLAEAFNFTASSSGCSRRCCTRRTGSRCRMTESWPTSWRTSG